MAFSADVDEVIGNSLPTIRKLGKFHSGRSRKDSKEVRFKSASLTNDLMLLIFCCKRKYYHARYTLFFVTVII